MIKYYIPITRLSKRKMNYSLNEVEDKIDKKKIHIFEAELELQ